MFPVYYKLGHSMNFKIFFAVLSLCYTVSVHANSEFCSSAGCDDVHLFLARGNNEPYPGRQAALIEAFCTGLSNCGYEDLIYSALYTDLSCQTTYDGTIAGHTQMTAYAQRCPNSKLILAGYSQGAQIVTDILGGAGGISFNGCIQPSVTALDPTTSPGNKSKLGFRPFFLTFATYDVIFLSRRVFRPLREHTVDKIVVVAAITFGNTRHTANQPYNYGNGSAIDGLFPRPATMLAALDKYSGILRDWCLQTDPICADNQPDSVLAAHLGYYDRSSNDAASWMKSVASLTDNSDHATVIPISISGSAQDYATIGTATPSGSVTLYSTNTILLDQCAGTNSSEAIVSTTSLSLSSFSPSSGTSSIIQSEISSVPATTSRTSSSSVTNVITSAPTATTSASGAAHRFDFNTGILVFYISTIMKILI